MKKLSLFCILTFMFSNFPFAQEYQWIDLSGNIPDENQTLYDIHFISPDTGWISELTPPDYKIYYTSDGGKTFTTQNNEYGTCIQAIYMLDANTGYAGGTNGIVYKTSNGGEDWLFHGSIGGPTITDITFPPGSATKSLGYGCGQNGTIFEITSTGINIMTSNFVSDASSISFSSNSEGWVCGENVIRHYTNGAWIADQSYSYGSYVSIYFVPGTSQGWCVGDQGDILHTTDGLSWFNQTNPAVYTLYSVFFQDTLTGWVVGGGGMYIHTTDGGENWIQEDLGTTNTLGRVFAIEDVIYVTGSNGTLFKYGLPFPYSIDHNLLYSSIKIYPNPVKDKLKMQSEKFKNENVLIELFEMNGRRFHKTHIQKVTNTMEIDVSDLQAGMYLCQITINNESAVKKIIIE